MRKNPYAKGYIYTEHDYENYPYALINGSNKNVSKIIKACKIKQCNQLVKIKCPSYSNFLKKRKEKPGDKFKRKTTEYEDELKNDVTKRV